MRGVLALGAAVCLSLPATAAAHGDPAIDELLAANVSLPFGARIDSKALARLSDTIRLGTNAGFRVKVALIRSRFDLGPAFSFYGSPQRYSERLGRELSRRFHGHLIVVMPSGFGVSIAGRRDPRGIKALKTLPAPANGSTRQANAASTAVRRVAAAYGYGLSTNGASGGASQARDRITIGAALVALAALLAGIALIRKRPAASTE
jgi:hypothetical protein